MKRIEDRQLARLGSVKDLQAAKRRVNRAIREMEEGKDRVFHLTDMIEKPSLTEVLSNYSILGRVVLPPEIFPILEKTRPGAGGEIQLTDAMKVLAQTKGMMGVEYTGTRYDMGNKFGILQAIVEVALQHPQVKDQFRDYLKEVAARL